MVLRVEGFLSKVDALRFEWMWKHMKPRRGPGGVGVRLTKLDGLIRKERWTEAAPLAKDSPLVLRFMEDDVYGKALEIWSARPLPAYISTLLDEGKGDQNAEKGELDADGERGAEGDGKGGKDGKDPDPPEAEATVIVIDGTDDDDDDDGGDG
eukprot:g5206.t1